MHAQTLTSRVKFFESWSFNTRLFASTWAVVEAGAFVDIRAQLHFKTRVGSDGMQRTSVFFTFDRIVLLAATPSMEGVRCLALACTCPVTDLPLFLDVWADDRSAGH